MDRDSKEGYDNQRGGREYDFGLDRMTGTF